MKKVCLASIGAIMLIATIWLIGDTNAKPPKSDGANAYDPYGVTYMGNSKPAAGQKVVMFDTTFTPTSSTPTLNIAHLGLSSISVIMPGMEYTTSTATAIPDVSVNTKSTSAITFNIKTGNTTIVSLAGTNVSSNIFAASVTGYKLHVIIHGKK